MNYAVIKIQGSQYKVTEGQELLVDKLGTKEPKAEVLLAVSDSGVMIGKPLLDKVTIQMKVITDMEKGEKVVIQKFKAKSRYRRKTGFRAQYTRLLVEKISESKSK